MSRTGRSFSVDERERHRGTDEGEAPPLGDREVAAGEADVVIGGEDSNQADHNTADRLKLSEAIQRGPGPRVRS